MNSCAPIFLVALDIWIYMCKLTVDHQIAYVSNVVLFYTYSCHKPEDL